MAVGAKRNAKIELGIDASKLDPGINQARRKLRGFGRDVGDIAKGTAKVFGSAFSGAASSAGRLVKAGGSALLGGLGIQAAGGITGMLGDVLSFEKAMTRLQITGSLNAEQLADFRGEIGRVSAATGVSRDDILKAASGYVEATGDIKGARTEIGLMAEVMAATGSPAEDVAGVMAVLRDNMKLDPTQWRSAFDILIKQGHEGSIEMANVAKNLSQASAMFSTFEGGASAKGLAEVSALAQVVNKLTRDPALTGTYLKDAFLDLRKDAAKLRNYKIEPFTKDALGNKVMKDPIALLDAIANSKLAKDPELLKKVFPDVRGLEGIEFAVHNLAEIHRLIDASVGSNQLATDFQIQQASASAKIERAWNGIKLAVAEAFTPDRIEAFASAITQVAKEITAIVGMLSDIGEFIGSYALSERGSKEEKDYLRKNDLFRNTFHGETAEGKAERAYEETQIAQGGVLGEIGRRHMLSSGDIGTNDPYSIAVREGGFRGTEEDFNTQRRGGMDLQMINRLNAAIAAAVKQGMAGATIIVKADGDKLNKAGANAVGQSTRPGGRR